ncbi:pyruvate dehydrogenase (acetyl-transferring), homodimeric type [Geothermobacter hydrogeniphilus]|uniref:Pyruvate dehydrogenase E1 component n=1 Tax=Geothermobacter hydrogeniphilus TaxID=1969733 RepID=A0A2K2HBT8_9BACT|nr:pyruvate dehydrogenase (acetyl-transferring), homodimeric type [Geothermobacter hydrogeniphilus]PNU20703.1 pyruvate dehydrogenase (acetyl-transferring), homodimeric type [Geothermobacter hydrogeniphilus]
MSSKVPVDPFDLEATENAEWRESLDYVLHSQGPDRVRQILRLLQVLAQEHGVSIPFTANTPYINTIPRDRQPVYPGEREIERRIKSIIRWNAMAMVVRANQESPGIGGHISTFASAATLWEVGFNHFWRGRTEDFLGDMVYFQGHASPGIYARAFLEGRLSEEDLNGFRHELRPGKGGLSSYPHPFLMPDFWEFPTVSMGLTAISAIYQARFNHYLVDRGLRKRSGRKVWAMLGDGEMDEPESLGAITLAAREKLDNLIFVINCNLQRLDGPVRGNGKIIQELEAAFRGAGWNVIKVIWGNDWDRLLEADTSGKLVQRMDEVVDGEMQRFTLSAGAYVREHFFGKYPELTELVKDYSDEQLGRLTRGGHDPDKIYAAYKSAVEHQGSPTVILAQTIKGYGLGEAGEGKNITHAQKKLNEDELKAFRTRFNIPVSDREITETPFYRPAEDSPELRYLRERRAALGGTLPKRQDAGYPMACHTREIISEYFDGSGDRPLATTMAYVHLLTKLLKDPEFGKLIVPIVPDEARTFGMESLFRQAGIYSHVGQLYEPVDKGSLLFYNEKKEGAILEEGLSEAGSMASFIAAGTAHANNGVQTIPFYTFYSMFGFQRVGDLIWAACDSRARGFLIGATAGRTTLAGEGLQHQDGHSHVLALTPTRVKAYDPAFAYELAIIIHDGLTRMYCQQEDLIYYLTVMNETYPMPAMPRKADIPEGILKGMYRFHRSTLKKARGKVHLLGSGAILNETLKAQSRLEKDYAIAADVWSVTSYKELYCDAVECERWNLLHPGKKAKVPYLRGLLENEEGTFVAASDYMKVLPAMVAGWFPGPLHCLGTDGFGRSDDRASLRDFFEVDERYITLAALKQQVETGSLPKSVLTAAARDLKINADKLNPHLD